MNTFQKIKSFINNVLYFKIAYILLAYISFIPLTRMSIGFLTKFILIWGLYLIIDQIILKRNIKLDLKTILVFCFLLSYCVSYVVNWKWNLPENILNFGYTSLNLIILLCVSGQNQKYDLIQEIKTISKFIIILSLITSSLSVFMFVFVIKYKLVVDSLTVNQGWIYNRLWGVYSSPNAAGMLVLFSFTLSFIIMALGKKKKDIVLACTNMLIQYFYFLLIDSRGAQVCSIILLVFILIFGLKYLAKNIKNSCNTSKYSRFFKYSCLYVIILFLFVFGSSIFKPLLSNIPNSLMKYFPSIQTRLLYNDNHLIPVNDFHSLYRVIVNINENDEISLNSHIPNNIENKGTSDSPDVTSNQIIIGRENPEQEDKRLLFWETSLKIMLKTNPIFGVGDFINKNERFNNILNKDELKLIEKENGNSHNVYIQTFIMAGLVGGCLLLVILVLFTLKAFITLLMDNNSKLYILMAMLFAIILSFFVNNLVESHLILRDANILGIIAWIYIGYLYRYISLQNQKAGEAQ